MKGNITQGMSMNTVVPNFQSTRGLTMIEAIVSCTVLSIAMMTFLATMRTASLVSNEELAESDVQTKSRELMDAVEHDLTTARILYLPNDTAGLSVGPVATVSDPDAATNPAWVLMRYQVPLVNNDPNSGSNPYGPGSFSYTNLENYQFRTANPGASLSWGAYGPNDPVGTPGASYQLVFKSIKVIDEAVIGVDLDGDNALTTKYMVGELQRRFTSVYTYSPTTAGNTIVGVYPARVAMVYDSVANTLKWDPIYEPWPTGWPGTQPSLPKFSMFYWLEYPGDQSYTGWLDGIYHVNSPMNSSGLPNAGTPAIAWDSGVMSYVAPPPSPPPPPAPPADNIKRWRDENFNGKWDPILCMSFTFIEGERGGKALRMKRCRTRIMLRNQTLQ